MSLFSKIRNMFFPHPFDTDFIFDIAVKKMIKYGLGSNEKEFYVMLLKSSYKPNPAATNLSKIKNHEIQTNKSYHSGGAQVNLRQELSITDPRWKIIDKNSIGPAYYGVLYSKDTTNAKTEPIYCFNFRKEVTATDNFFCIMIDQNGLVKLT